MPYIIAGMASFKARPVLVRPCMYAAIIHDRLGTRSDHNLWILIHPWYLIFITISVGIYLPSPCDNWWPWRELWMPQSQSCLMRETNLLSPHRMQPCYHSSNGHQSLVKAQFATSKITAHKTYVYVVTSFTPEFATVVHDFILTTPMTLKTQLIKRTAASQQHKIYTVHY